MHNCAHVPQERQDGLMKVSRKEAARQCVSVFDTNFFKAFGEPSRIAVLQELILLGRSDIAGISARLPQDRSVITRHLQLLAEAGVVRAQKEGRHVFYQLDAPAVRRRLEEILTTTKLLESAMGAELCKVAKAGA
jgi:DNA-binding transcriptional ArsR family regulator